MEPAATPTEENPRLKYSIEETLGEGVYGVVFKVSHEGRHFVLRTLRFHEAALGEAKKLMTPKNERLVGVEEVYRDTFANELHVITEFAELGTLKSFVEAFQFKRAEWWEGPGSPINVGTLIRHIAGGLNYLHSRGFVHKDVKPTNVLACGQGARLSWKLTEFSLDLLMTPEDRRVWAGRVVGASPSFAAPEILKAHEMGDEELTSFRPEADMFSFGAVVAYFCDAAIPAFQTPGDVRRWSGHGLEMPSVYSHKMKKLVESFLSLKPKERPKPVVD